MEVPEMEEGEAGMAADTLSSSSEWNGQTQPSTRAAAGFGAAVTAVFLSLPLMLSPVVNHVGKRSPPVSYVTMVADGSQAPSRDRPAGPAKGLNSKPRDDHGIRWPISAETLHQNRLGSEAAPLKPPVAEVAAPKSERPETGPQAPLDLSLSTVNRAVANSRSGFRSAAQASGAYTGEPAPSPAERLARDAQGAAKEDCLRPGAGLLSPLFIFYELATDKCSTR